ncbi:MAG: hypothetical protein LBL28_04105 [Treponema sp.]|jgi:hypothetical protein|nr:hypothetical protein [Treponema sp.]
MNSIKDFMLRFRAGAGFLPVFLPLVFFFAACNQNAIFYTISQEPSLREPQIKGTPSNMVVFDGKLYVANRFTLYRYGRPTPAEDPIWDSSFDQPGGEIRGVAATKDDLFVLTGEGLKRFVEVSGKWEWKDVSVDLNDAGGAKDYTKLQTIYADEDWLFVGSAGNGDPVATGDNYAILYWDGTTGLKALKTGVHLLSGAVYNGTTHFLSTLGSGIFTASESGSPPVLTISTDPLPNSDLTKTDAKRKIVGIIYLEDAANTVVAVDRSGEILAITTPFTGFTPRETKIGNYTTGALALWRTPASPRPTPDFPELLLAGIQGTLTSTTQSYTNGYRDIELGASGGLPTDLSIHVPGTGGIPSISNSDKYTSSLGKIPINYLFQVPSDIDPAMPIFASTSGEGLWSYRDHEKNRDEHWNAE